MRANTRFTPFTNASSNSLCAPYCALPAQLPRAFRAHAPNALFSPLAAPAGCREQRDCNMPATAYPPPTATCHDAATNNSNNAPK